MVQIPIEGAGGIVVRDGEEPLIAIVQRRKDNDWVLPKGKCKRSETAIAAAEREVVEETGHNVSVHEFLGVISYKSPSGKPKVVQFWRMQAQGDGARKLMRDIKAVKWLPLASAIEKLDHPLEQLFLRNVGERALAPRSAQLDIASIAQDAEPIVIGESAEPSSERPVSLPIPMPDILPPAAVRQGSTTAPIIADLGPWVRPKSPGTAARAAPNLIGRVLQWLRKASPAIAKDDRSSPNT